MMKMIKEFLLLDWSLNNHLISQEKVELLNERGGTEMLIDALPISKHNMSMDVDKVRAEKEQFNYLNDGETIKKSQTNNYNFKLMHPDHRFKDTRINSRLHDKVSLHKS